ncbi:hypothetical protein NL676_013418 [Syzygium grande]|nr:hypothetical protein NL676_013418 [Syzygium grande]
MGPITPYGPFLSPFSFLLSLSVVRTQEERETKDWRGDEEPEAPAIYSSSEPPSLLSFARDCHELRRLDILWCGALGPQLDALIEWVSGLFIQRGTRYSTTLPSEPDTHDDFKPMDKFRDPTTSLKDVVQLGCQGKSCDDIHERVPYNLAEVPLRARNILENAELKSAVKLSVRTGGAGDTASNPN